MTKNNNPHDTSSASGWQNKKKMNTRAAIQREALRLFKSQGYNETTIEQIAEAAEISRITFFRYFATKADVVLADIDFIDDTVMGTTLSEPSVHSVIHALRKGLSRLFLESPGEELEQLTERHRLLRMVPELRTATLNHLAGKIRLISSMVAERVGRHPDDFAVCNLSGAIAGVWLAVWIRTEEDYADGFIERYYKLLDAGLEHLETGLPL